MSSIPDFMASRWEEIKNNPKIRENLIKRDLIIREIRNWFYQEKFSEAETPQMVKLPGMEPYLNPFRTTAVDEQEKEHGAYLITSPEYAMKKLLAAGFNQIFQICKCFRNNEPFGGIHNPEFTMLEWYRTRSDYKDLMNDTEQMITSVICAIAMPILEDRVNPKSQIPNPKQIQNPKFQYQNLVIDFSLPWERLSVKEAFSKFCGLNLDELLDTESIRQAAKARGYKIESNFKYEDIFFKIFLNEIEPNLGKGKPVFLYDYPAQMAALSKLKTNDPRYAERFELYIGGLEIANAFSELIDPREQRKRLEEERALRQAQGRLVYDLDEDFLTALGSMPESAGIALGVDRLLMILLDARDINEVISFPASREFRI